MSKAEACIDCDRPMLECVCEGVLRCSCGVPDEACVCAGPNSRLITAEEFKEALRR